MPSEYPDPRTHALVWTESPADSPGRLSLADAVEEFGLGRIPIVGVVPGPKSVTVLTNRFLLVQYLPDCTAPSEIWAPRVGIGKSPIDVLNDLIDGPRLNVAEIEALTRVIDFCEETHSTLHNRWPAMHELLGSESFEKLRAANRLCEGGTRAGTGAGAATEWPPPKPYPR